MPEALSQAEIEALMRSVVAGGPAPGTINVPVRQKLVKAYDFRRPDKFSKEHLRALRNLHDNYARLLGSSLASYLRTTVQVRLSDFEQTSYSEYISTLPTPTVLYVLSIEPARGQALLQLDLPTGRAILERLLGGAGGPSARTGELTEIESALLRTLANTFVAPLAESWATVQELSFTCKDATLIPEYVQIARAGELTLVLLFEVTVFNMTGALSLCFPYPVIQPSLEDLAAQVWSKAGAASPTDSEWVDHSEQLAPVEIPIIAELGRAEMTTRDLVMLAPGQIIKLGTSATGPVLVRVGGRPKFTGRPGISGRNLAVQITETLG